MKIAFKNKEECIKIGENKKQTNPKYKGFEQLFFTVGDKEQANKFLLNKTFASQKYKAKKISGKSKFKGKPITDEIKELMELNFYKNFNNKSVSNTFKYLFDNIGTGIFIQIKNNKLEMFVPFYNNEFENYYSDKLKIHPKYNKNVSKMSKDKAFSNNRNPNLTKVINDKRKWGATNCFIWLESGRKINDLNYTEIYHMLQQLCKIYKVPDCEFFVNRKDTATLTKKLTEPFFHLFGKRNEPLRKNKFDSYVPILSYSVTKDNADIPIPTPDDWEIVTKMMFPYSCRDTYLNEFDNVKWEDKIPTAFFRGGATGCGVTIFDNPRLKVAHLSSIWKNNDKYNENNKIDGIQFLDAGVTAFNPRYKKTMDSKYINFIKPKKLNFGKADYFPMSQQTKYKYLLDIEGNVSAYRLAFILASGSLVLKVDSQYKIWFSNLLEPWVHYVPVKNDLSDLAQQITWCKQNDKECKKIAINAQKLVKKYINEENILNYLHFILSEINKIQS